jgi:hypothetical protein
MASGLTTEQGAALRKEGKKWIERFTAAASREKSWIDDAEIAVATYANAKDTGAIGDVTPGLNFNILFSNVETIVPAVINSPPAPDIRRRFGDADPVAKDLSELLERSITVQVDDSRLQIEMEGCAQDAFLAGRGIVRLRFKANVKEGYDEVRRLAEKTAEDRGADLAVEDDTGADTEPDVPVGGGGGGVRGDADAGDGGAASQGVGYPSESVSGERICFEAVSWRDFRHGPAKRWEDVQWMAFRHAMAMEDRDAFADTAITNAQTIPEDKTEKGETENDVIVWELWNKRTKKVWFIEEDTGKVLKRVDDPLGLTKFFPIADPVQPIEVTGRLMPVNAFAIYRKLADELDLTTRRIRILTDAMKVRGWYPGSATDLANMVNAGDNEWVPIADAEIWAQNGGLQGAVAFWPVEKFIVALRELYIGRDQTKQAIYEITGISDIVRGASQAQETATAQQIKTQWGSLRIQKFQRMMERLARDLFVMMSEIIPAKFSAKTLEAMTSIQLIPTEQDMTPTPPPQMPPLPPEAPPEAAQQQAQQMQAQYQQAEQARMAKLQHMAALNALMRQPIQSYYRINVESDSTVRADLTRQKAEVAEFLQGAAAYFQAVGPLVQSGQLPADVAVEIFASNARMFNLGKSVEDALDRTLQMAKEKANQPPPPNPEQVKAEGEQKKLEMQAQIAQSKAQSDQAASQVELERINAKAQADIAVAQGKAESARVEMDGKLAEMQAQTVRDQQAHALEMQKGQLELRKIEAEIVKIQVGTAGQVRVNDQKAELAERNQDFKEQQAEKAAEKPKAA